MQNNWITYIDRSYTQIKDAIISKLKIAMPEITDFTENNILMKLISVWAGITEMLSYYIDNMAREFFLSSAELYSSAVKTAALFQYRIKGVKSATTTLKFYIENSITEDITIPKNTIVKTEDDIEYFTIVEATLLQNTTFVEVEAQQGVILSGVNIGTSTGLTNQRFEISKDAENSSVEVVINEITWTFTENLALHTGTEKVFTTSINKDKKFEIKFGDGVIGEIPLNNQNIIIKYVKSIGSAGNLPIGYIENIVSTIPTTINVTIQVTNTKNASGGNDIESLTDLKVNIPQSIRVLNRAVTEQDYKDIPRLVQGVEKAFVTTSCTQGVKIYIAPKGGGIASNTLLQKVEEKINLLKTLLTNTEVLSAGEVEILLTIKITEVEQYQRNIVIDNVKQALLSQFDISKNEISGNVYIGDIYQTIENVDGVKHSSILNLSYKPFISKNVGDVELSATIGINKDNEINFLWRVTYIGNDTFEIYINNIFQNTIIIEQEFSYRGNSLRIQTGNYVVSNSWEFTLYPTGKNEIELQEPSMPVLKIGNITIEE